MKSRTSRYSLFSLLRATPMTIALVGVLMAVCLASCGVSDGPQASTQGGMGGPLSTVPGRPSPGHPPAELVPVEVPPLLNLKGAPTYLIGIYEARSDHSGGVHPEGTVTVDIAPSVDGYLIFSSAEPVLWRINVAPGARIRGVFLNGYHRQRAVGVGQYREFSYEGTGEQLFSGFPYERSTLYQMAHAVERRFGGRVVFMGYGYTRTQFNLPSGDQS